VFSSWAKSQLGQLTELQLAGTKTQHLSPSSPTEVYAQLCNVARIEAERGAGIHFRPGYEYGPGLDDLPENLYGPDGAPFYNYLGPEDTAPEPPFSNPASQPGDNTPVLEPPLQPSELQPHYLASHSGTCSKTGEEPRPAVLSPLLPACQGRTGKGKYTGHRQPSVTPNLKESVTFVAVSFCRAVAIH
jgi:hypothetical protein